MEVLITRTTSDDELKHYGVLGMKWGVRRAQRLTGKNERLQQKAHKYDIQSNRAYIKSEKIHANKDLGRSNRAAAKSAKYDIKATKLTRRAQNQSNEFVKSTLEKRAAKAKFKSTSKRMEANRLSKMTGYGNEAMKYAIKSDKLARKADKARLNIAKNNLYITKMKQKVNTVSDQDIARGRDRVEMMIRNREV